MADENSENKLDYEKIRKIGVRFAVYMNGSTVNVWESQDLRNEWINYINNSAYNEKNYFDYLSGETVGNIAAQHPKNINSLTGNAKLLSCNDKTEFTFRGRFSEQNDAIIIDYAQSQRCIRYYDGLLQTMDMQLIHRLLLLGRFMMILRLKKGCRTTLLIFLENGS